MEILAIPLQNTTTRDTMIWNENCNKTYTVKSVYRAALRIKEQARIEHSMARLDRPI